VATGLGIDYVVIEPIAVQILRIRAGIDRYVELITLVVLPS
jgi:hypothetical protein